MKHILEYCEQISSIDEYLLGKNKKQDINNDFTVDGYCFACAWSNHWEELCEFCKHNGLDTLIKSDVGDPQMLVMPIEYAKNLFNSAQDKDDYEFYKIPNGYDTFEEVKDAYDSGKILYDELDELNLKKL